MLLFSSPKELSFRRREATEKSSGDLSPRLEMTELPVKTEYSLFVVLQLYLCDVILQRQINPDEN